MALIRSKSYWSRKKVRLAKWLGCATTDILWEEEIKKRFCTLKMGISAIKGVSVESSSKQFNELEQTVVNHVRARYRLETLKDEEVIRRYRDFYWREIKIDPTKIRPASEALVRRILRGQRLPRILNVVDAYNLASIETMLSFGAFDLDKLRLPLTIRLARRREDFLGIGMKEIEYLSGKEPVIGDKEGIICVYPYRDSDRTKITKNTRNVLLLAGGVPGISESSLINGIKKASNYITQVSGGRTEEMKIVTTQGQRSIL